MLFKDVPGGRSLEGYYAVAFLGRAGDGEPVHFDVRVDGELVHEGVTKLDRKRYWLSQPLPEGRHDVKFTVRGRQSKERHFCFHAQVVE